MRTILHSPPILFVFNQLAYEAYFFALVPVVTSKRDDSHIDFANCPSHKVNLQLPKIRRGRHSSQAESFQPFRHHSYWPLYRLHKWDVALYKVVMSSSNVKTYESRLQTHLSCLCVALVYVYHNIFYLSLLTFYNLNDYNTS